MKSTLHHNTLSTRFSAAAHTYAAAAHLQRLVAKRVLDMIPEDFSPASVLDAGCGPGGLMKQARMRWPNAKLTGVDIAPGMIRTAVASFEDDPLVDFALRDIRNFQTNTPYDAVVSSSALHWLNPFDEGLDHVVSLCRPGGLLAIGIMLDGTLRELHEARRRTAAHKSPAGRLPTLNELEESARQIPGGRIRRLEQTISEYDQPSGMDVLRSIHEMGVTGGHVSRGDTPPLTRGELRSLAAWYDANHATPDGVRVTFVTGYLLLEL